MHHSYRFYRIIGLVFACFLVLSFTGCKKGVNPVPLEFESMEGQFALLDRVYPEWFGEPMDVMENPTGVRVICDWVHYRTMASGNIEGWEDSTEQFNADAMDYVMENSIHADYWASIRSFEVMVPIYEGDAAKRAELVNLCKDVSPELDKQLDVEITAFKEVAQKEGFLDAQGKLKPEMLPYARLLHRKLWVAVAGRQFPRARIEPPEEQLAFFRWQIERSTMTSEQKLQRIAEFRLMMPKAYDYDFAIAVILNRDGRYVDACAVLTEALHEVESVQQENMEDNFRVMRYKGAIETIQKAHPQACAF